MDFGICGWMSSKGKSFFKASLPTLSCGLFCDNNRLRNREKNQQILSSTVLMQTSKLQACFHLHYVFDYHWTTWYHYSKLFALLLSFWRIHQLLSINSHFVRREPTRNCSKYSSLTTKPIIQDVKTQSPVTNSYFLLFLKSKQQKTTEKFVCF